MPLAGPFCVQGEIGQGDQDIFLWTVSSAEAMNPWAIRVEGLPGQQTRVQLHRLEEPPSGDAPAVVGAEDLTLVTPADANRAQREDVFVPAGTWVVGLSVSGGTGGYRLQAEPNPVTAPTEKEAGVIAGEARIAGDLSGAEDVLTWNLDAAQARQRWTVRLSTLIGSAPVLELQTADASTLARVQRLASGEMSLGDVGLEPGSYRLKLSPGSAAPFPYLLGVRSEGPRSPSREDEPNDAPGRLQALALGKPLAGRIAEDGDIDMFSLPAGDAVAGKRLELSLSSTAKRQRKLCVLGSDATELGCREGLEPKLTDLVLPSGSFHVAVTGTADRNATYTLTARVAGVVQADTEREPNDSIQTATAISGQSIRGRFVGEEADVFRIDVTGEPQLWQIEATGAGITAVEMRDARGTVGAHVETTPETRERAVLKDVMLIPGQHFLAVAGKDGTYALALSTTGKPDPNAEREPNDLDADAVVLGFGDRRTGTLAAPFDTDLYRFTLTATERVSVHVDVEGSCPPKFQLSWPVHALVLPTALITAPDFVYRAQLELGDYSVSLRAQACDSESRYRIRLERDDPGRTSADLEPNDAPELARPLPPSLSVSGTVGEFTDNDWFKLPELAKATRATIRKTGAIAAVVQTGTLGAPDEIPVASDGTVTLPAGTPVRIGVEGRGAYTLEVALEGVEAGRPLPAGVTLALSFPDPRVAAFWPRSQRIAGELTVTNGSAQPVDLALATSATHYAWHPRLARDRVSLAPAATERVPVVVEVDADAWSEPACRVLATARQPGGDDVAAAAELRADPIADPRDEHLAFPLPDALLGGFNVSWSALGATVPEVTGEFPPEDQTTLHDMLATSGGLTASSAVLPAAASVSFGGQRAWPVAGVALNPYVAKLWPGERLLDFELLLSTDGTSFEKALTARLDQQPVEQFFLLDGVRPARAAKLRLLSSHGETQGQRARGNIGLGEWKVIADPKGAAGIAMDLADPARGGHIVWTSPQIGDEPADKRSILEAGGKGPPVGIRSGAIPEFVVGFHENRAAQISKLEWFDPIDDYDRELKRDRFAALRVSVSTDGPIGPWQRLGTWNLTRGADGWASWQPPKPVWARFVRFTAATPTAEAVELVFPTQIRIHERATDDQYRSIVGEWGHLSPLGGFEAQAPAPPKSIAEADGNDTRAGAQPIRIGESVEGQVVLGRDEDWFRVDVPPGVQKLDVIIDGRPTADVDVAIEDADAKPLTVRAAITTALRSVTVVSIPKAGTYWVRVLEPPHSIAILFDTSGSLLDYLDAIYRGLGAFAPGVVPGREVVNVMPFEKPFLLKEWSDQRYVLEQAIASDARESTSSNLETTMIEALRGLGQRRGSRAVLVITDAATSSYALSAAMWELVAQVRPRVFAAHIGAWDDPLLEKQIMQDLALANGGIYTHVRSQAEMDVAYERVAAWLRRPTRYRLTVEVHKDEPAAPGAILVETLDPSAGIAATGVSTAGAIELVLDASGSMLQRLEGRRRIEIARAALNELVTKTLPRDARVALRVFGHDRPASCETSLVVPLAPLDPPSMTAVIDQIMPQNLARTPIAASLREVANDLADVTGMRNVILITDGEETCDGDPRAEIDALIASGIAVRINIVGFAVDDEALKARFREWARAGGGEYFDARDSKEITEAVKRAATTPFTIVDASGQIVGRGDVGGGAVPVPSGTYRVEVGTATKTVFEGVVVEPEETARLRYRE
jgi:hypothetical protein